MPNRLARETSPYLRQHADNPVEWYAWGPDALERARAEDKPILLSVGYSACHWCHVMAHESFEDAQVAALMNLHFVNVKVDREERPDIDQIYQAAHQMLARGTGGWPLTMFLSPDGTPFFGGTYFPKTPRYGLPGFGELLERIAGIWREKRAEIREQNEQLRIAFSRIQPGSGAERPELDDAPLRAALESMHASFDARFGGFGQAPKFPHPTDLELCLRAYALRGDRAALEMAEVTLTRMCEGGIYDQLGGGFCRYSVDQYWMIPHFEKMLYDNGLLLALLADAWLATGNALHARCAEETAAWMEREMQSPEGGYYSSLDADSEHEEGKFYVWSREEMRQVLSAEEWRVAAPYWGLDRGANFEDRHWHLHVARTLEGAAKVAGIGADEARALLDAARKKLFAARERRVRPGRDEKVLVSWNALAIRGMARAGRVLGRADWIASARRALALIRSRMWRDGRLLATYKDGRAHLAAYLDDYAFLAAALLELLQCEYAQSDLEFAQELAGVLLEQFEDREEGGFFFTAQDHEKLLHRPKPAHDSALPSGNGVAAFALGRLAALTGEDRFARAAVRTLQAFFPAMHEHPAGFGMLAQALDDVLAPPATLVLRGAPGPVADWSGGLAREFLPDTLVLAIPDGTAKLPAALDKPPRPAPVTAWLCRGAACLEPIGDLEALKRACTERRGGRAQA
ncbi:MAG: thioredoxin [Betaproteobacteria bacterium RIFCSPLOWO2_02_67_12]|nr:MAG: thioredoxin [Betaproteobacteria bacterium RIFCSPLOWO2_02_67_12]